MGVHILRNLFGALLNDNIYIIFKLYNYDIHIHKQYEIYEHTSNSTSQYDTDIDTVINIFESNIKCYDKVKIITKFNHVHFHESMQISETLHQIKELYNEYNIKTKTMITYD